MTPLQMVTGTEQYDMSRRSHKTPLTAMVQACCRLKLFFFWRITSTLNLCFCKKRRRILHILLTLWGHIVIVTRVTLRENHILLQVWVFLLSFVVCVCVRVCACSVTVNASLYHLPHSRGATPHVLSSLRCQISNAFCSAMRSIKT